MRILILKNNIQYSIAQDVQQLKDWLTDLGLNPILEIKDIALPLEWASFGFFQQYNGELWGLVNIKEKLRQAMVVPPLTYDIVFFCYDSSEVNKPIANWTYPNHLNGSAFCEIPFRDFQVGIVGQNMIHECTHAFNRLLTWRGIYIVDNLDNGMDMIPYYKPHFQEMLKPLSIAKKLSIIQDIINWIKQIASTIKYETIEQKIRRIAQAEGVDPDLAVRVAKCESGLNPKAINVTGNTPPSTDRGLFQINDFYHPEVTDAQAFDPEFSIKWFCKAVRAGNLSWWSASANCWKIN